jgi:hypothetical protein
MLAQGWNGVSKEIVNFRLPFTLADGTLQE